MGDGCRKASSLVDLKPAVAPAAVVGYGDPGGLFMCVLPLLAAKEGPTGHKRKTPCYMLLSVFLRSY